MKHEKALADFCAFLTREDTDNICFACHVSPDGDTLGSAVALARLVRARGRRAFVSVPEAVSDTLSFLFRDFDNTPFVPDTVVAVDVSTPERLGRDFAYLDRIGAVIDHHEHNTIDAEVKFVAPEQSATAQLVAAVYDRLNVPFDEMSATALYTALSTDTGRFCHPNTTPEVFALASRLCAASPSGNFGALNRRLFVEKDAQKLRLEAYVLSHARVDAELGTVCFCLTQSLRRRFGLTDKSDLSSLVDVIRAFRGFDVFMLAKEQKERGVYKLSVRTEGEISALELCAGFGGGGHRKAAGCTLRKKSARAVEKAFCAAVAAYKNR